MIKQIKTYKILEEIGKGGMSHVYLARNTKNGALVAVKILRDDIGIDEEYIEKFFNREAKISECLSHENIVKLLDYGKINDKYFLIYEYIEGISLDKYLSKNKSISIKEIKNISIQILKALAYAHSQNIVHRDIKPQNIIITNKNQVKIVDFGIAKTLSASTTTTTGIFIGSPSYISPEQADGKKVDRRADIYSFGIMLFEILSGRLPFASDTPWGIIHKHIYEEPPDIKTLNKNIPDYLTYIVAKCIVKNPQGRFSNVLKIIDILSSEAIPCEKYSQIIEPELPNITTVVKPKKRTRKISKKIKVLIILSVVVFAIYIILAIAGGANNSGGNNLYNNGDYLSAAYKYRAAQRALFPGSGDRFWLALDDYSKSIEDDIRTGQLEIANEKLNEFKYSFPGHNSISYLEDQYIVSYNLSFAKNKIDDKNYEDALLKLEEILKINPGHGEANELYTEIREIESKILSFENTINYIYDLTDANNYKETYSEISELIEDPEFEIIMGGVIYNNIFELKDRIYNDYSNIIDEDTKTITFYIDGNELSCNKDTGSSISHDDGSIGGISSSVNNVLGEGVFTFWFEAEGPASDRNDRTPIFLINIFEGEGIRIGYGDADMFLLATDSLIMSSTRKSVSSQLKKDYEGVQVEIVKKGGKYIINKYGETFEIVIDSVIISDYWFEELMVSISIK